MDEIVKHINDTNASYRDISAGNAKNTDLFLDNEHYKMFEGLGEQITVRFNKTNLAQAILFIASILPRKYDNSSVHKTIKYSRLFVKEQLDLLDGFFQVDGQSVETKTQVWNARINVPKKNGEIDTRFYFNGLLQDFEFYDDNSQLHKAKFTLRNYLAGGYSDVHIKKAIDGIFDVSVTNALTPTNDGKENGLEIEAKEVSGKNYIQKIYYGTPGSGKSHTVKSIYDEVYPKEQVIRTTFHPDTDYATFVGGYKPVTSKEDGKVVISYSFVPQSFTKAYVKAWNDLANPYFLIIEEINRGNCAQIFGDIFQLLDRSDDGYSEYTIDADADLRKYLESEVDENNKDILFNKAGIKDGKLCLPPNLNLIATMNTSDQSLFPMDTAFKRRWSWEYVPIEYDNKISSQFKINIGDETFDWSDFLPKINEKIKNLTSSEDKQMGNFFIKHSVDEKEFINKVMFYLWSEVAKDNYQTSDRLFVCFDGDDESSKKDFSFNELYEKDSEKKLIDFMHIILNNKEEE